MRKIPKNYEAWICVSTGAWKVGRPAQKAIWEKTQSITKEDITDGVIELLHEDVLTTIQDLGDLFHINMAIPKDK